jgi:hypothetical protein
MSNSSLQRTWSRCWFSRRWPKQSWPRASWRDDGAPRWTLVRHLIADEASNQKKVSTSMRGVKESSKHPSIELLLVTRAHPQHEYGMAAKPIGDEQNSNLAGNRACLCLGAG